MTTLVADSTLTDYAWSDVLITADSSLTNKDFFPSATGAYIRRSSEVYRPSGRATKFLADGSFVRSLPGVYIGYGAASSLPHTAYSSYVRRFPLVYKAQHRKKPRRKR